MNTGRHHSVKRLFFRSCFIQLTVATRADQRRSPPDYWRNLLLIAITVVMLALACCGVATPLAIIGDRLSVLCRVRSIDHDRVGGTII